MKIYIAKLELGRTGGGWTFMKHFHDGMGDLITTDYNEADIYFICSPSMVQRDEVQQAKADGKKIVLRIDNAVRNSRNRNTGMTRMKDFYSQADLVVFQSQWAREYLLPFLDPNDEINPGEVILNGVPLDNYSANQGDGDNILYSRFNRDETKNWEVARYWFSQYQLEHPFAKLHIVGQFSPELQQGNFDFYNNEHYEFYGVLDEVSMSRLYGVCQSLLYTYFNDACSNTLIEALVSGCNVVGDPYFYQTGGAAEILSKFKSKGRDYFGLPRMVGEYQETLGAL